MRLERAGADSTAFVKGMPRRTPHKWGKRSSSGHESDSDDEDSDDSCPRLAPFENTVYFYGEVTTSSVGRFARSVDKINRDLQKMHPGMSMEAFEIKVYINSMGGCLYGGLALYDIARLSKVPVTGIVQGAAASSATLLLMGCAKRVMSPSSLILIHQISSSFWGKHSEWQDENSNMNKLMKRVRKIYQKHSVLSADRIRDFLLRDLWWSARKCQKYRIIDSIQT